MNVSDALFMGPPLWLLEQIALTDGLIKLTEALFVGQWLGSESDIFFMNVLK